ncbi:MAG: hypothetical protein H0T51_11810 [Pirellulales bacterium]|nr:hypothetical protein [Pirellulales bacterium]
MKIEMPVAALVSLAILSSTGLGAPVYLEGLPASFTPNAAITFDVMLPPITGLGAYNIDLVLSSDSGVAGGNYFFDVAATSPAPSHYAFPSSANYFDAVNIDSPNRQRLTLTDFVLNGVSIVSGTNDRVARVVIGTTASFFGNLELSIDADGLLLDISDTTSTPVPEFESIRMATAMTPAVVLRPVPEPSTFVIGMILIATRPVQKGCQRRNSHGAGRRARE